MAIRTSFFNGVEYSADDVNARFSQLFSSGIITETGAIGTALKVTLKTGLTLNVANGTCMIRGAALEVYEDGEDISVPAANSYYPRIDTIVVEYNLSTDVNTARIAVVSGTPASNPTAPVLSTTSLLYQLPLANVRIEAGATTVGTITDRRSSICAPLAIKQATAATPGAMSASDKAKLNDIENGATKTTVDTALSNTSANPVQNKVIAETLAETMINRGAITDANDAITPGVYYLQSGTTNTPDATRGFMLASFKTTMNNVHSWFQLAAVNGTTDNFFIRSYSATQSVWGAWRKITTTAI